MPKFPDIYLANDLIVYKGLSRGGFVGKGWSVDLPDFENSDPAHINTLEDDCRVLLQSLNEGSRMQVNWSVDADYKRELLAFQKATEEKGASEWEKMIRNERFVRYWERMEQRKLRREKLTFYVTSRISREGIKGGGRKAYEALLNVSARELQSYDSIFNHLFGQMGGGSQPLDDLGHFRKFSSFCNPILADDPHIDFEEIFEPQDEILNQCMPGDAAPLEKPDFGFHLGGFYHGVLVIKSLPKSTFMGMMRQLTSLQLLDYGITVNIRRRSVDKEIIREEGEMDKLRRAYNASPKVKLSATLDKKDEKIRRLMSNHVQPFDAQWIIRAWDQTKDGLRGKIAALRSAITKMGGCQIYEPSLPTSARNFWCASIPGWCWDRYEDFTHYVEDVNLVNLLPISSTPVGNLKGAEAIYDGNNFNIVGVRTFEGLPGKERPAHALMLGSSGAGKSVSTIDLLTQTGPYYDYTVIVEEGLSYGVFTELNGEKPIIIQPGGNLTFNYLDTRGLPLNPMHLGNAVSMCQLMVGSSNDSDKNRRREALLSTYINQLYRDITQEWSVRNPDEFRNVSRHALSLKKWLADRMPPGSTKEEAFMDFRDWKVANADEGNAWLEQFDDGEVTRFSREPETAFEAYQLCAAYMKSEEMPTHGQLQELLYLEGSGNDRNSDELNYLATLLEPWCAHGNYGPILDGVSNIDIGGKVAHFELGYIPESAEDLRAVAASLITNQARNEIMRRPRGTRKRVILEELSAFLAVPNGERITREFYERMRKYNCWVMSVIQQYDRIRNHPVRSSVMGNARQVYMLKQQDRVDLDHICETFPLPEVTKDTIRRFPDPSAIETGDPWAGSVYYHLAEQGPIIATTRNYSCKEMIFAASSSGEAFDQRSKDLAGKENILEAVVQLANA